MTNTSAGPKTLAQAIKYFSDKDIALAFMVQMRWPDGVRCPRCTVGDPSFLKSRSIWKCKSCKKQFSVKVGTIFEDSPLGLDKWLPALWLLANAKNGISSYELGRSIGVTQKSAWFMLARIRLAMQAKSFERFDGVVEIDETFVGGLSKFMHKSRRDRTIRGRGSMDKTPVFGMLKRGPKGKSRIQATVAPELTVDAIHPKINATVEKGSAIYTDSATLYHGLSKAQYEHEAVDHEIEYVREQVHTNGIENFWSLLKRAIKGTYVSVDPYHLFRYVDEQVFRFNNREQNDGERFVDVARQITGRRLTYRELTGADLLPATT